MRACFEKNGVPSPKFAKVCAQDISPELFENITKTLSLPLVVKPVDNMGARGCRMVRSKLEFWPAVEAAVNCSRTGYAIIEEYMDGPEFSIDALVYDGKFNINSVILSEFFRKPHAVFQMPQLKFKINLKHFYTFLNIHIMDI